MMKKTIVAVLLIASALILPAQAAPTIKMLNDSRRLIQSRFLRMVLPDIRRYNSVVVLHGSQRVFHTGPVLLCRAEYRSSQRRPGLEERRLWQQGIQTQREFRPD